MSKKQNLKVVQMNKTKKNKNNKIKMKNTYK